MTTKRCASECRECRTFQPDSGLRAVAQERRRWTILGVQGREKGDVKNTVTPPRPLSNSSHSPVGRLGRGKEPSRAQTNNYGNEKESGLKGSRGSERKWSPAEPLKSRLKAAETGE